MLEVIQATKADRDVINNLMEKYLYEFSQWELTDVNSMGLYDYEWLDGYFTEEHRYPYILKSDGKLVGFILISDYPEVPEEKTDYCLSEFFIMHKYRRNGFGKQAAFHVFNQHRGKWQLKRHPHNKASVYFWDKVVKEYTSGNYRLMPAYPNEEVNYEDGTPADVFFFDNSDY